MAVATARKVKLTYAELIQFPDDGKRHELIDGEHYMAPAPYTDHQSVSRHIQFALYRQLEETGRAYIYNAPVDVQFDDFNVVEPDLVVVMKERRSIIIPSRIRGVPDLVVEILSPGTARIDRGLKLRLYESNRVPEYWMVDIDERTVYRYRQTDGAYGEPEECTEKIEFAGAVVDLSHVWSLL